ncbi:MAG: hypothetical protein M3016_09600 [Actinomycetota bacterium]|nr:hypothetical protein [Actinomycetota bacterium]
MGLLDDAIREHLDLKRRRGADPTEVERDEREALGPVRRAQPSQDGEVDDQLEPAADVDGDEQSWTYEEPADTSEAPLEPPAGPETAIYEPEFDSDPRTESEEPHSADPAPSDDQPPPSGADLEPDHLAPKAGGETVQYDVESAREPRPGARSGQAPEADEDAEGEELLEETPEFLQDTPDHDRLWFEQRPPKDFDFDG